MTFKTSEFQKQWIGTIWKMGYHIEVDFLKFFNAALFIPWKWFTDQVSTHLDQYCDFYFVFLTIFSLILAKVFSYDVKKIFI